MSWDVRMPLRDVLSAMLLLISLRRPHFRLHACFLLRVLSVFILLTEALHEAFSWQCPAGSGGSTMSEPQPCAATVGWQHGCRPGCRPS